MNTALIIIIGLLPAVLLWLYIWKKDPQPEPTSQLVKAVLWGVGICIPVAVLELVLVALLFGGYSEPSTLADSTLQAFLVAAIPEESIKLLALWIVLRKNPFFDEHVDGIVYAVCVGLGFAAVENVFFLLSFEEWVTVAISRALLAVPGHYAFAVLMGYYYSVYHFVDHSPKSAVNILLFPVLAHGIYDTFAMSAEVSPYLSGICSFALIFFCVKMHTYANGKLKEMIEMDRMTNNN